MDKDNRLTGRVTIPTDVDVVSDTLKLMERWGADALRDCDGTDFPEAAFAPPEQRYMPPITPPARIMTGPVRIRMKCSSATS